MMAAAEFLLGFCLLVGISSVQGISNSGNEFYLMFPPNLGGRSPSFPPILFVTTDDDGPVQFTVSYNKASPRARGTSTHTATKGELTRIELPEALKDSFVGFAFDGGINLKAEEGKNIIVYGLNEDSASTDVYLGLPYFETKTGTYDYYGVSVPRSSLEPKPTNGYMAIVTLEDNTVISITPTVSLEGFVFGTPLRKMPGTTYRSIPQRKGVTFLLRSREDLTGTKISSNNPITFITGHECGFLPSNVTACDHLTEQLPPAETFGFRFVLVPLRLRQQDGYKIVASRDGTMVNLNCVNKDGDNVQKGSFSLNEGQFRQLFIHSDRYCTLESNLPLLVVQIALGHSFDDVTASDPFMTMVPPLGQYRNDYTLLFVESFSVDTMGEAVIFEPQLSVSVPSSCFNRDQILFDGQAFPDSAEFVAVQCEDGEVCAYAAQYQVPTAQSRGAHTLKHSDPSCTVGVVVYGYERENTYGYPGGMNLDSIAVPNYCFKDDEAKGSEPSGVLKFTLQNTGVAEEACVTFSTTDGTATGGTDFVVENSECCFKAGEKEAECEIKVNEDSVTEGDEEFTISLVAKEGQCVCDASLKAIISEALVAEVQFEKIRYSVEEGDEFATLTLESSVEAPSDFSVQVSFSDGSATGTDDYNSESVVATFLEGESSASVKVPIVDDDLFEGDEDFQASLSVSGSPPGLTVSVGERSMATVTIEDNEEKVYVNFSPVEYNVTEGAGRVNISLVASAPLTQGYMVEVTTVDGTATGGDDYDSQTYFAVFPAGEVVSYILVDITDDAFLEGTEYFNAQLSVPQVAGSYGVRAGDDSEATVNILDDEEEVFINFSPVEYSYSEGDGNAILTLEATSAISEDYVVIVNTSDGSAIDGSDYTGGQYEAMFLAGETTATVSIPLVDDEEFGEGIENFFATLSIPITAQLFGVREGTDIKATVNIEDDDVEPQDDIEVNFAPTTYNVEETSGFATLNLAASASADFNYTVLVNTADGSAVDGEDFAGGQYEAFFLVSSTSAQVQIPINADRMFEGDESFTAQLSIPSGTEGVIAGSDDEATINIADHEQETFVNFSPTQYTVSEDGNFTILQLKASAPASHPYLVYIQTNEGDAKDGSDYTGGLYNVTFAQGSSEAELYIPIVNDGILEPEESFTATLSVPEEAATLGVKPGNDSEATVTITDDDSKIVNFSPTEYSVTEDGSSAVLMLMLNAPAGEDCTVQVETSDGTAEDGLDYTGGLYEVTFAQGTSKAELSIPILNDEILESKEEFTATIKIPEEAVQLGVTTGDESEATVTITDDDSKIVNFNPTEYSVSEDGTYVILMLMLNAPAGEDCTVQVETSDGTAEDGSDYTGGLYNVTFTKGNSKAELHIPIIDDDILEPDETFTAIVIIPDSADGVEAGDDSEATVTIANDDEEIVVSLDPEDYTVNENDGFAVITVKASTPSSEKYTVMINTQDGTATETGDYAAGPYPVMFAPGETEVQVMIPLMDDDVEECDEDFFGQLSIPEEAAAMGVKASDAATATVTIDDNDTFEVNFVSTKMEVFENESKIVICLENDRNCMEEFTVQIGNQPISNMSASSPDDYQNGPYDVTFEKGKNIGCVDIPVIDDGVEEGPENFQLEIIPAGDGGPPFQPGLKSMAQVTLKDGNIDGDPMFTVPLNIDRKMLSKFSQKDKQWDLCYEVHGREEKIYNLVSDQCVFVNTHLKMASNPKVGNIMARIGIMAMDNDGKCHRILADLDGKILTVNGVDVGGRWMHGGIIVRKFGDKVDVAVPNCNGWRMVFSIIFHYMNGADMIKFIIADGRGLSPSSHGLIGQFWNTPVEIQEVTEKQAKTGRQYKVVIYSPFTGPREFIGDYYPITWDYQKTPCLYAGTKEGSPVIEGKFTDYEVKDLFNPKFDYSQFSQKRCSK